MDVSNPTQPTQLSRFRCAGGYNDVSIWKDLVFLSQDGSTEGDGCDATSTSPDGPKAFAGIRVISIADPKKPVPVAAVPTGVWDTASGRSVEGSHTHTLVPDVDHTDAGGEPSPRILVYSADGYEPGVAPHGSIVEVPLRDPSAARVVGTIDNGTPVQCHDISVFIPRDLLVCGAHDAGVILFDISDPVHPVRLSHFDNPLVENHHSTAFSNDPVRLSHFDNPLVENHHSTAFSNDGNTLVLDDEVYTGLCAGGTGQPSGALWFYDISDPRAPEERGFFQLPRPTAEHACYAHESNVVPMPDRDIVVTGWFGGGVNLVDFTDPRDRLLGQLRTRRRAFLRLCGLLVQRSCLRGEHRAAGGRRAGDSPRLRCVRGRSPGVEDGDPPPPYECADAGAAPVAMVLSWKIPAGQDSALPSPFGGRV